MVSNLGLSMAYVFGFYFGTVESRKYVDQRFGSGWLAQVGSGLAQVKD